MLKLKLSTWTQVCIYLTGGLNFITRPVLMISGRQDCSENVYGQTAQTLQVLTIQNQEDIEILDRLGCPNVRVSGARLLHALLSQTGDLLNTLYDTFYLNNGQLLLINESLNLNEQIEKFFKEIVSVYYTAKLTFLKSSARTERLSQVFDIYLMNFEEILQFYSSDTDENSSSNNSFNIFILLAFGLLVSALSEFINDKAKKRIQPALFLLISLAPLAQLSDAFKIILPPAHQGRLFALTLYRDLQVIESKIEVDDIELIAKLKVIMEVALSRYGSHFLSYYSDEILNSLNQENILDCPAALWKKATQDGHVIQTELGPSFLVNLIKYQWGIIKDSNGIVPDPTIESILVYNDMENLFEFLDDQAQQLYLLLAALNAVLTENPDFSSFFSKDSETLILIYIEFMDYLVRLSSALMDSYTVRSQSNNAPLERKDQVYFNQSLKVYVLLLTINICSLQLTLTGPLQIPTAPSISPILEYYISKSDFSAIVNLIQLDSEYCKSFKQNSSLIFSNYSMISNLSKKVLNHLEGVIDKTGIFGSGISLNLLFFSLFVAILCLVQFIWLIQSFYLLLEDCLIL